MKRQIILKNILSLILMFSLIAGLTSALSACGKQNGSSANSDTSSVVSEVKPTEIGEGNTKFTLIVADKQGNETIFAVSTNETNLATALKNLGLIEGEDSQYGLFIKKVNGIVADYDIDQTYWAFYVGGEYSNVGADSVTIKSGETYKFAVSK